jgi:hypothetical protein
VIVDKRIWYDARKETKIDTLPSKYQGLIACEEFRDKLWKKGREIVARRKGVLEDRREDCIISEHKYPPRLTVVYCSTWIMSRRATKFHEFAENDLT